MKNVYLLIGLMMSVSFGINADYSITENQYNEIKYKVSALDESGLKARETELITEINQLNEEQENTQSPSKRKENEVALALLFAELSEIQKVLIALFGVAIIDSTSGDGSSSDNIPPLIGIIGSNPATVELGTSYVDAGAFAIDRVDGSLQVTSSGSVNTNVVGTYTITYSATDSSGNSASATRTVNVVDTTAPVVTVTGDNPATVELGTTYTDAGATATDASGDVTVVTSEAVNVDTVGTYTVTYTSTDASGNIGTATRTVNVVDTTAPVVTVTGDNPATVELGATYTDAGATATDASGDVTVVTTGTVDTDTVGTYTITYTSTDASDNAGTATRTVNVVDTTAPVFTSSANFTAAENQTAIGTVTATDITAVTFTISGTELDITSAGVLTFVTAPDYETKTTYTATVTATDANSNAATQDITVIVTNDESDDDSGTGTGTGTGTSTGTSTGTGTGT
jgi:hypothetical protein